MANVKEDRKLADGPLHEDDYDALFACLAEYTDRYKANNKVHERVSWLSRIVRLKGQSSDPVRILLAVSGGADSLALMVLCHEWCQRADIGIELFVASVDHRLRPESGDECAYVAQLAQERGLSHRTLVWEGEKSHANLQAEAREARYRLLTDYAEEMSCHCLVLAHHLNDQAETVVMRLLRGSGVSGLGAMHEVQRQGRLTLLRPFLSVPKTRLVASLLERKIEWAEDPSNNKKSYLRARVRAMMPVLAEEGCSPERLGATARRMQRADAALSTVVDKFFQDEALEAPGHSLWVNLSSYCALAEEFRLRILRKALIYVAGPAYPPREIKLLAMDEALQSAYSRQYAQKRTVGGCCFDMLWRGKDGFFIYREPGRNPLESPLFLQKPVDWLGLCSVRLAGEVDFGDERPVLHALGQEGRLIYEMKAGFLKSGAWNDDNLPVPLIEALPSVWWRGEPCAVMHWSNERDKPAFRVEFEENDTIFSSNTDLGRMI